MTGKRKGAATHAQCIAAVEVLEKRVESLHGDLRLRTTERDDYRKGMEDQRADGIRARAECNRLTAQRDDDQKIIRGLSAEAAALRQGMEDHRAEAESLRQSLAKSMAQTDEALGTARNAVATATTARAEADEAEASAAGWEQMHHKAQQKVGQWKAAASLLWELARKGDIAGATSVAGVVFGAKE